MKLKYKYVIGCLVQWYEIELVEEYLQSVRQALKYVDNSENVIVDIKFTTNQQLERIDKTQIDMSTIEKKFLSMVEDGWNVEMTDELITIADYRRWFNDFYCETADVLMWGETDSLIPRQTFKILDDLHDSSINNGTYKYLAFFGGCKMWDKSWEPIEHNDFTDKPFIDGDTENWWSLRYNMTISEMNDINDKVDDLDVRVVNPYKFNGCGLVISSDVIRSGVNIPKSVFFVHEDTAFMHSLIQNFQGKIPQFIIKNILLVHNRKHPQKRNYVLGEKDIDKRDTGALRKAHDWYEKANKMSEYNAYNLFNQSKTYKWGDVFK